MLTYSWSMRWRKLLDRLQAWLYLAGFSRLARFIGRWCSPPDLAPMPLLSMPTHHTEHCTWTLDDTDPTVPLCIIDFDPRFRHNPGIDVARDVAWPTSKYDVN